MAFNASATAQLLAAASDWSYAGESMGADFLGKKADKAGPVFIDSLHLGLAVLVIIINGLLSIWLRLALHTKLGIATVRVVLQLSILGYILVPIFSINKAWLSCLYMVFMLLVATIESVSRPAQTYEGMLWQVLVALGAPSSAMLAYGLGVVVRPSPWYEAQYLVPVMGMLLGNACSGVAVGLSTLLDDLSGGRDRVEQLLALGATRLEAAQDAIRRAARMALTPTINQMNVAGIVAIPGMMTGQILGGADPTTAARYQIVLLLLIAATSGMGSVGAIFLATFTLLDNKARLRSDRLHPREATGKGVGLWIATQCKHAWRFATGQKKKEPTEKRDERGRAGPARHEDEDDKTPEVVVDKDSGHRSADDQSSSSSSDIRRPLLHGRDK